MISAPWQFYNPVKLEFGVGCVAQTLAALPCQRVLLVTSAGMVRRGTAAAITSILGDREIHVCDAVVPNPDMAILDLLAEKNRAMGPFDGVVALGGGSVIDTGKIIAALLGMPPGFSLRGHFLQNLSIPTGFLPVPLYAIPTTSGTGSEVTPFATVWDMHGKRKYSLAGSFMFPQSALLDPAMTYGLPWDVTLYTGLDAMCQAFESIWNRNANPLSLSHAMHAAGLAWRALHQGKGILEHDLLRSDLMEASLFAGLAISHTRTALCHSMSYPLTIHYGIPHGLACGFTMPSVLEYNKACDDGRLADLADYLDAGGVDDLVNLLCQLFAQLELRKHLRAFGLPEQLPDGLYAEMVTPGRSDNNLRPVSAAAIRGVFNHGTAELLK